MLRSTIWISLINSGAANNIRRNIADEVNQHGIIDTLSWVSQSIADWTVPQVRHPKPVDIALNYYGHKRPKHVGNVNYGHSSKHNLRTRKKSNSNKYSRTKPTRSRRPNLTTKRRPWKQHKRKKDYVLPPGYSYQNLFNKKTINNEKDEVVMPSKSYSFPLSRQDPSIAASKTDVESTVAEFLLGKYIGGKINSFGKTIFGWTIQIYKSQKSVIMNNIKIKLFRPNDVLCVTKQVIWSDILGGIKLQRRCINCNIPSSSPTIYKNGKWQTHACLKYTMI